MRSVKKAIERVMIAARASARILNFDEVLVMEDPDLKGLRERIELELRRAYDKGLKARHRP
jgi:hypothetical protein